MLTAYILQVRVHLYSSLSSSENYSCIKLWFRDSCPAWSLIRYTLKNFECPISDIWSSLIKAPTSSFEKQSFGSGGGTVGIDPSSFYSDNESV